MLVHTFISVFENIIVGLILGTSTIAVISYGLSLHYGYPREGIGNALIQTVYKVLRVMHVVYFTLVLGILFLFGFLDGVNEVTIEYGVKMFVLLFNAYIAYGMATRKLDVSYAAPAIAGGWYFLAGYHSYATFTISEGVLGAMAVFAVYLALFQVLFIGLRRYVPQREA